MDNVLILQVEDLGFDSCWVRLFSFFIVVLFCFVSFFKKIIWKAFCNINLLGKNVTFDSKPKKARTYFLI